MRATLIALALASTPASAPGHQVTVEDARASGPRAVSCSIQWDDAFRDGEAHDAVWIVLRSSEDAGAPPLRLASSGHAVRGDVAGEVRPSEDGVGAFVQLSAAHRGAVRFDVTLALAGDGPEAEGAVSVWPTAMVHVPAGAFELGDDHPDAVALGAFHRVGEDGAPAGVFPVSSEAPLVIGDAAGALGYAASRYQGDGEGPLPEAYPKGTRAFYVMRRELTQGEYARFLNALSAEWVDERRPDRAAEGDAEAASVSIAHDGERFVAAAQQRPCNFVTWADTCAYFDFVGLRPLTEFEFEKAARGVARPVPLDFPWGTATTDGLRRRVEPTRDLTAVELVPGDDGRVALGRSWCGALDLSGSLWERVVSAGHPLGRAYRGTHGDGVLDAVTGDATNVDWPRQGDARGSRAAAPGIGFRGGAEYFAEPSLTNPYSPVGVRTYAAYDGAQRYPTYSARGARTAPVERR